MSSLRNAAYRRNHPERPQPLARGKLGLLEKHKDYVARARDRHKKEDTIKKLKEKARLKNEDEFYYSMSRSKTSDGVHILQRDDKLPEATIRLIKNQHLNYINLREGINRRKLENLKDSVQVTSSLRGVPVPADDGAGDPEKGNPRHMIFLDSDVDTEDSPDDGADSLPQKGVRGAGKLADERILKIYDKGFLKDKDELYKRLELERKLKEVQTEYQLRKNLNANGSRIIIGKDQRGLNAYKWRQCRKR